MITRVFPNHADGATGMIAWRTAEFKDRPGLPVYTPECRAVMLDPDYTSPGLAIAVSPDDSSGGAQILHPGDVALFDRPVRQFRAWNIGNAAFRSFSGVTNWTTFLQAGWVGFLASPNPAEFGIARPIKGPRWPAGVIYGGSFSNPGHITANPPANNGCTTGFLTPGPFVVPYARGLRFSLGVSGMAGAIATPADFACTIRPWIAAGGKKTAGGSSAFVYPMQFALDEQMDVSSAPVPNWQPIGGSDLVFSPGNMVLSSELIVPGGFMAFTCTALAGTGVIAVVLLIEAF